MRRYAVILKRRQRNTITLRQLFNEWLPIHSQAITKSAVKSYHIAFKHISNIADMPITKIHTHHVRKSARYLINYLITQSSKITLSLITPHT